jgi:hypothetical protein
MTHFIFVIWFIPWVMGLWGTVSIMFFLDMAGDCYEYGLKKFKIMTITNLEEFAKQRGGKRESMFKFGLAYITNAKSKELYFSCWLVAALIPVLVEDFPSEKFILTAICFIITLFFYFFGRDFVRKFTWDKDAEKYPCPY